MKPILVSSKKIIYMLICYLELFGSYLFYINNEHNYKKQSNKKINKLVAHNQRLVQTKH
jgi:hypothetical protein